jgi:hypothetical protein
VNDGPHRVLRRDGIVGGRIRHSREYPLVITMLVAMFTVHLPHGFSSIKLT